ncbi:MAG: Ger(x)C family spore germination C-terminal domain-containing protein [Clostridia bacterium]
MSAIKRIALLFAIGVVFMLLSNSIAVTPITQRAVIIGLGVDWIDQQYCVTCEVLSPQGSGEGATPKKITKVVSGVGQTISIAIDDIHKLTGQLPSLGQCGIIVFGKELFEKKRLNQILDYFVFSDAFKDGTSVACFDGRAKDLFSYACPLTLSVGFALSEIIQDEADTGSTPNAPLSRFMSKQFNNPSRSYFLSYIKFIPNGNMLGQQKEGNLKVSSSVVFKDYLYKGILTKNQQEGYNLLYKPKSYNTYLVENKDKEFELLPDKALLGTSTKQAKIDYSIIDNKIIADYKCKIKLTRTSTDNTGRLFGIMPLNNQYVNDEMKKQVEEQIKQRILDAFSAQAKLECDYLEIANSLYQKYGSLATKFLNEHKNAVYEPITINFDINLK